MAEPLNIEFDYRIDGLPKEIRLLAQVEQVSQVHYMVKEIKSAKGHQVLASQRLMKENNLWVHVDSHLATYLSRVIGDAIEHALSNASSSKTAS